MKRLLILSYYFPPLGLGGTQRIAKFVKYLPQFGWQPTVVTVKPVLYWAEDESLMNDVADAQVVRTESWDPQRLLARLGKKRTGAPSGTEQGLFGILNRKLMPLLFQPDVKILWRCHALTAVKELVRQKPFDALLTTSPPHSTHLIGRRAAALFKLPWLADFRDGWAGSHVVSEPNDLARRRNLQLQRRVVASADAIVACSKAILESLLPEADRNKKGWVITNGYDPEDFAIDPKPKNVRFTLCYSGTVNRWADPAPFLKGLAWAMRMDRSLQNKIRVLFVGLDMSASLADKVAAEGLAEWVTLLGHHPHRKAVSFLAAADGLLLLVDAEPSDTFIPGKTFEYIGAQKPMFVISNSHPTNDLLRAYSRAVIVTSRRPEEIGRRLIEFIDSPPQAGVRDNAFVQAFDRRRQTALLAQILDKITAEKKFA
ncbi:MAG: glycosyltransferase [candidate division KSB1 bacterium]|nr:glycosyltransferase [candidate division KSB1 bacterium]